MGTYCLVWIGVHDEGWPFASMKLDRYVAEEVHGLIPGDRVSLVIADETPLGVKAVVNHRFWGLLYANELFQRVHKGQTLDGYVKTIRPDKRLDVTLSAPGYAAVDLLTDVVLQRLEAAGGFLPLTDKSPPEAIYREFGVSKKQFKQAVGALFKRRRVALEPEGIRLLPGRSGP